MWAWLLSLLPSDWLSTVWGIIPTAGIAKWWGSRQERLKREAELMSSMSIDFMQFTRRR